MVFVWTNVSIAADTIDSCLTTLTGITYENVSVTRFDQKFIIIKHKTGISKVYLQELPVGAFDRLAKEIETKRQKLEEQLRFEEEQKAKGLVKYQGQWITQAQKAEIDEQEQAKELNEVRAKERERGYIAKADEFVMGKAIRKALFRVFQPLPSGALCSMGYYDENVQTYVYLGAVFFLVGVTNKTVVDGEAYYEDLFWAGTYTYTTRQNIEKTVNCYCFTREVAQRAVRFKLGLFDKAESRTKPASPDGPRDSDSGNVKVSSGSGFIITKDGYLITNRHVVNGAKQVEVRTDKQIYRARVVAQDANDDVALLKIDGEFTPVSFASETSAKLGQTVFTVGFPLPEFQGFSAKVTKGVISGLRGIRDDSQVYQIDATIQPGNSGGPLADERGNIVGVVVARLSDAFVMRNAGVIPQNVNYSVKKSCVMALVSNREDVAKQIQVVTNSENISFEEAVEKVRKSTVLVVVYREKEDGK